MVNLTVFTSHWLTSLSDRSKSLTGHTLFYFFDCFTPTVNNRIPRQASLRKFLSLAIELTYSFKKKYQQDKKILNNGKSGRLFNFSVLIAKADHTVTSVLQATRGFH